MKGWYRKGKGKEYEMLLICIVKIQAELCQKMFHSDVSHYEQKWGEQLYGEIANKRWWQFWDPKLNQLQAGS